MPSSYPGGFDSFSDIAPDDPTNAPSHSQRLDDLGDAIEAVEAELGLNPSGVTYSTVAAFLADAILKTLIDAKGDSLWGDADNTIVKVGIGANGTLMVANSAASGGVNWRVLQDSDIPAAIARDSEVTALLASYQLLAGKDQANGYPSLDSGTKVPFAELPTGTGSAQVAVGDHTHAVFERAFVMGVAGTPPAATTNDVADFNIVVPFAITLRRMKAVYKTAPSSNTTVQIRRSTNSGSTFSNAFGTATVLSGAKVGIADPADLAVNEGDVLQFSITSGGNSGANLAVMLIGSG